MLAWFVAVAMANPAYRSVADRVAALPTYPRPKDLRPLAVDVGAFLADPAHADLHPDIARLADRHRLWFDPATHDERELLRKDWTLGVYRNDPAHVRYVGGSVLAGLLGLGVGIPAFAVPTVLGEDWPMPRRIESTLQVLSVSGFAVGGAVIASAFFTHRKARRETRARYGLPARGAADR